MPTLYTCTDAEAPMPPQSGNRSNSFDAFCAVLRGCLVTGYGAKSGAGWEELHYIQHRTISFRPANKLFVLTLVNAGTSSSATTGMRLFLSESVTEFPTSWGANQRPIGNNVRSGYYSPDTNPSGNCQSYNFTTVYWGNWSLVADANTFAFFRGGWSQTAATSSSHSQENYMYCGLVRSTLGMSGLATVVATGGYNYRALNYTSSLNSDRYPWGLGSTFLRNPLTGLINNGGGIRVVVPPFESVGNTSYTASTEYIAIETGLDSLDMIRIPAHYGSNNAFGYLKGVVGVPSAWGSGYGAHVAKAIGLYDQTSQAREWFGVPVTLEDGFEYSMCGTASWPTLLTNNPDFW